MQKGRFYLLVLGLAGVLTMGPATVHSQAGVDTTAVNARAAAILADIEGRMSSAKTDDVKKCLRDKRSAVNAIKGRIAGAADLSSLMSELNAVGGELDACTGETSKDKGKEGGGTTGGGGSAASGAGPAQVEMKVEQGTPGAEDSNPSVVIAPGPTASGPGVVDNGTSGGGGDLGGDTGGDTGGGDTGGGTTPVPVVPPPPLSPMM